VRKHPEYFNSFGGSIWRVRIYTMAKYGVLVRPPIIYRGLFGSAGYQSLYAAQPAVSLMLCTTLEYHVGVTLPLWVLSVTFHYLLPLAVTSLLISLGVCGAAAAQAALPRNKRHWWSRPLVAVLFSLQPIVRGLARYQGRLAPPETPLAAQHTLDSVALHHGKDPLNEVRYWAEQRVDRLSWVAEILRRLDKQGWAYKSDIGWSDYDVEVYGSRWSNVQITTVAEDHPPNKQMIRCRLRPRWSLQAKVAFWSLCAAGVLATGMLGGSSRWWLWPFLAAPLGLSVWFLRQQARNLQSTMTVFLDTLAKEWKLVKVGEPVKPRAGPIQIPGTPLPKLELTKSGEP
jgi:hypothetical protein